MKYLRKGFIIGRLLIMLGSNHYCFYKKSNIELARMKECIYDSSYSKRNLEVNINIRAAIKK